MKNLIATLILSGMSIGCATQTPYIQASKLGDYGYYIHEGKNSPGFAVSVFSGNQHTPNVYAYAYTVLAAHDWCMQKVKVSRVMDPKNYSFKKTRTGYSTHTTPNYNSFGQVTSYNSHTYSYPVTTRYPRYISSFQCETKIQQLENLPKDLENIPRDLVHEYTKDFAGGILVNDTEPKPPFKSKDVIIRYNKARVETEPQLIHEINKSKKSRNKVQLVRNGKIRSVSVKVVDQTKKFEEIRESDIKILCDKMLEDQFIAEEQVPPLCISEKK